MLFLSPRRLPMAGIVSDYHATDICHSEGRVLAGPATRALERVRLTLASDGRVVADRAAIVNGDFRLAI